MTAYLADVLRAEGCKVSETSGWKSRGRAGAYAPFGVLNHHTATPSAGPSNPNPTLNLCINGRSDLPGPLCQVMIGYDGVCHIIAAGRANHAGSARNSPPIPAGDGNAMLVGYEWDYSGVAPPGPAQYQAAVLANAAVLRRMGRDASYAKGHRETSNEGKPDPGHVDLNKLRADIAARLGGAPPGGTEPGPALMYAFGNGGQEDGPMAQATHPNGKRLDICVIGSDRAVWHYWTNDQADLARMSKESLGGQGRAVSCSWLDAGRFVVTVTGTDNGVHRNQHDGKKWSGWAKLPDMVVHSG